MNLRLTLDEIFHLIPEAETEGDSSLQEIGGISSLESARVGDLLSLGTRNTNPKLNQPRHP